MSMAFLRTPASSGDWGTPYPYFGRASIACAPRGVVATGAPRGGTGKYCLVEGVDLVPADALSAAQRHVLAISLAL
jgi:hypothetical protein